ncbi:MAG: hypothetical protein IJD78_04310 [Clostridia bacterium]|nr:hypothetical protein [Clostridia bacterium]
MGGSKDYISDGGFSKYEYNQIGTTENGIKIIDNPNANNTNTPLFSNTPYTAYAKLNKEGTDVEQVSVYGGIDGRQKIKDIDTEHHHDNKIKRNRKKVVLKSFSKHEIHVHEYAGTKRSEKARKPSKKERRLLMVARYGKRRK